MEQTPCFILEALPLVWVPWGFVEIQATVAQRAVDAVGNVHIYSIPIANTNNTAPIPKSLSKDVKEMLRRTRRVADTGGNHTSQT